MVVTATAPLKPEWIRWAIDRSRLPESELRKKFPKPEAWHLQAERTGFEPAVGFDPYTDLANRRFRPLSHLSNRPFFKA